MNWLSENWIWIGIIILVGCIFLIKHSLTNHHKAAQEMLVRLVIGLENVLNEL